MINHFFSSEDYAGPGLCEILKFWDRIPRRLRMKPRKILPEFNLNNQIVNHEFAKISDSNEISKFWNSQYQSKDWLFICQKTDVELWMNQGFILIIKEPHTNRIIGTFAYRKLSMGIYCGIYNSHAGIIDGLVVDSKYRSKGVASQLLLAMDYEVYNNKETSNTILIWFREHESVQKAFSQNPISVLRYSYLKIEGKLRTPESEKINSSLVEGLIHSIFAQTKDFVIASRDPHDSKIQWFIYKTILVGITYTHRHTKKGDIIWEVVFTANLVKPYFVNFEKAIEDVSLHLKKGLLFGCDSKTRGNLINPPKPWISGNSGYLTSHVFNWMPPKFYNGDIFFPHSFI